MIYDFPEPIKTLPKANIAIDGLVAYLAQSQTHQTLYMHFSKPVALPEHSHADQVGFVLSGSIELTVAGQKFVYGKGDSYHIPAGVRHSAKIFENYADITIFMQPDRYGVIV